jgi:hypothetical protein
MRLPSSVSFLASCTAAAAVVSSSATAAFATIDGFTATSLNLTSTNGAYGGTGFVDDAQNAQYLPLAGSNNRRRVSLNDACLNGASQSHSVTSSANGSVTDSGSVSWVSNGLFNGGSCGTQFDYGNNQFYTGTNVNLSAYTGFRVVGSGSLTETTTTDGLRNAYVQATITDTAGKTAVRQINLSAGALGNFDFDFSTLTAQAGFNWSSVRSIRYFFTIGGGNFGSVGSRSYTYTYTGMQLVPAPGAIALLGAAGLVGSRRRR